MPSSSQNSCLQHCRNSKSSSNIIVFLLILAPDMAAFRAPKKAGWRLVSTPCLLHPPECLCEFTLRALGRSLRQDFHLRLLVHYDYLALLFFRMRRELELFSAVRLYQFSSSALPACENHCLCRPLRHKKPATVFAEIHLTTAD